MKIIYKKRVLHHKIEHFSNSASVQEEERVCEKNIYFSAYVLYRWSLIASDIMMRENLGGGGRTMTGSGIRQINPSGIRHLIYKSCGIRDWKRLWDRYFAKKPPRDPGFLKNHQGSRIVSKATVGILEEFDISKNKRK